MPQLSGGTFIKLAGTCLQKLNAHEFELAWPRLQRTPCFSSLGSGLTSSVFRLCDDDDDEDKDASCTKCVAVKFGALMNADGHFDASHEMEGVSMDEVHSTSAITDLLLTTNASPHVVRFMHSFIAKKPASASADASASASTQASASASADKLVESLDVAPLLESTDIVFLFLEYVPPLKLGIETWHRLFTEYETVPVPFVVLRALLFQALYTLAALQAAFTNFRHNDCKLDNWAATRWDGADHTYAIYRPTTGPTDGRARRARAWRLPQQVVMLKLIDFGIAHSDNPRVHSSAVSSAYAGESEYREFGVVPFPCAFYDMHMLLCGIMLKLRTASAANAPQRTMIKAFARRCLPKEFWKPPFCNANFRLSVPAQVKLRNMLQQGRQAGMLRPIDALDDPLFADFRSLDLTAEFHFNA